MSDLKGLGLKLLDGDRSVRVTPVPLTQCRWIQEKFKKEDLSICLKDAEVPRVAAALLTPMPGEEGLLKNLGDTAVAVCRALSAYRSGDLIGAVKDSAAALEELGRVLVQLQNKIPAAKETKKEAGP
jgi:hypothetical protein